MPCLLYAAGVSPTADGARRTLPPAPAFAAAVAAVAVLLWLVHRSATVNQDTVILLDWGRDLANGRLPDYKATLSPTPHPLPLLALGLLSLPGEHPGLTLTVVLSHLAFAMVLVEVVLLGRWLGGWVAGVVAAGVALLSPELLLRGLSGQQDVTGAALVLLALLLALDDPRRRWAPLLVLTAAGLVRPEAWLLLAVWALWCARSAPRREAIAFLATAAAAPVLWAGSDLLMARDPLYSARLTRSGAESLGRVTGLTEVPGQLSRGLEQVLGLAPLLGGALGLAVCLALPRMRARAVLPALLVLVWVAAFTMLGTARLSLNARYLFTPALVLAAFAGWAVAEGLRTRLGPAVLLPAVTAAVVAATLATGAAPRLDQLDLVRDEMRRQGRALADLREVGARPGVRRAVQACAPLLPATVNLASWAAYAFDLDESEIVQAGSTEGRRAALLALDADALSLAAPPFFRRQAIVGEPPPGTSEIARSGSWSVVSACAPGG